MVVRNGCDIGVIGLGVMGRNLVANMADKGFSVGAYDPWPEALASFAESEAVGFDGVETAQSAEALVALLQVPRMILLMVKAGEPVDDLIDSLTPLLEPGDIIIEGGNAHYEDTNRRARSLAQFDLHFLGLGVSGGEEGARHGPALMAGGSPAAYTRAEPLLTAIAAKAGDEPCCAHLGSGGAGHFIKTIHNGIEYAVMQVIAEGYVLLRDGAGLGHEAMADVFREWSAGGLESYLISITADILETQDDLGGGPLVEKILDTAGQKGTGRWSAEAALAVGIPAPTIAEAVAARSLGELRDMRLSVSRALNGPPLAPPADAKDTVKVVGDGLRGAAIAVYAQGFSVISAAAKAYGWDTSMAAVARVWQNGCIIRARLLDDIAAAYQAAPDTQNLLTAPTIASGLNHTLPGWRKAVGRAIERGIPVPCLSSALAYVDGARSGRLWTNMIQAQRDCFGAHTYERIGRPGTFHSWWGNTNLHK